MHSSCYGYDGLFTSRLLSHRLEFARTLWSAERLSRGFTVCVKNGIDLPVIGA